MSYPDWDTPLSKQDVSPRELRLAQNEIDALPAGALSGGANKGPVASNPVPVAAGKFNTTFYVSVQAALDAVAAAGGGDLWINGLVSPAGTLNWPRGVNIIGDNALSNAAGGQIGQRSEIHQANAGLSIINTVDTGNANFEYQQAHIRGVALTGGLHGILCSNGVVQMGLWNVQIYNHAGKGLYLKGFCQEIWTDQFEVAGGQHGIYFNNENGTATTNKLLDKCDFDGAWCHGQSISPISIQVIRSFNCHWKHLKTQVGTQDAMVLGGGLQGWTVSNWNAEQNGSTGATPTLAPTTATTTSGSANVTVALGTGLNNGMVVTIAGAGTNGADWYPTILSGGGTPNLVMTTTAPTTVAGAELTSGLYCDLKITQVGGSAPHNLVLIGTTLGYTGFNSLRYAIDASVSGSVIIIGGPYGPRPVYDPLGVVSTPVGAEDSQIGAPQILVRRPPNYTNDPLCVPSFGGGLGAFRSLVPSPPGGNLVLALRDTVGDGSGTFGVIEVRKSNGPRTRVLSIDNTGLLTSSSALIANNGGNQVQIGSVGAQPSIQATLAQAGQPVMELNHAAGASVPCLKFDANVLTATAATAGANGAVPAQVKAYLPVTWTDGTTGKIPVFAN